MRTTSFGANEGTFSSFYVDYLVEQFYHESTDRGDKVDIIYALRDHKNTAALQVLIRIGQDIHEHEAVRALALQSVGIATRKQIIDPLFDILAQDADNLASDLIDSAFEALEIMTEDSVIRTEHVKGIRQRTIEILRAHNAFYEHVALYAIIYLGRWKCREAFDAILTFLDSEDPDFRHAAAEALGNIGDTRAIPKLTSMTNDPNEFVRGAVGRALRRLQDCISE